MVKYIKEETMVVFSEIPDEITLAINISNCPHNCKGCHSPYLQQDVGEELTYEVLEDLINKNEGITCVCFMGEGNDLEELYRLMVYIQNLNKGLKIGLYSGSNDVSILFWNTINYIKLGPYIEEKGPLNKETTNQRLYRYDSRVFADDVSSKNDVEHPGWRDITYKFWKKI